jgi:hypothetical protein
MWRCDGSLIGLHPVKKGADVLTKDILFGMNTLTLAGFIVMGLTLNRGGQARKRLSICLMAAGTALVFGGSMRAASPTEHYCTDEVADSVLGRDWRGVTTTSARSGQGRPPRRAQSTGRSAGTSVLGDVASETRARPMAPVFTFACGFLSTLMVPSRPIIGNALLNFSWPASPF